MDCYCCLGLRLVFGRVVLDCLRVLVCIDLVVVCGLLILLFMGVGLDLLFFNSGSTSFFCGIAFTINCTLLICVVFS